MADDRGRWDSLPPGLLEGRREAFEEFGRLLGPILRRHYRRRGLSQGDADELCWDTITDVALKVSRFRPAGSGSFLAWALTLGRHALADWHRRRSRRVATTSLVADLADGRAKSGDRGDDDETRPQTPLGSMRAALARLDPVDREIVMRGEGESSATIGAEFDLKPGNVRLRRHRALKKLQAWLDDDPEVNRWRVEHK